MRKKRRERAAGALHSLPFHFSYPPPGQRIPRFRRRPSQLVQGGDRVGRSVQVGLGGVGGSGGAAAAARPVLVQQGKSGLEAGGACEGLVFAVAELNEMK